MGSNNSSLNQLLENDVTTSVITNVITNNETNSVNLVTLSNQFNLVVKGHLDCHELKLTQLNQGDVKIATKVNSQTTSNLQTQLINDLKNSASQTNKLVQGFLAGIGQFNNTKLNQQIVNRISTLIQNNITTNNINKILSVLNVSNTANVVIEDGGEIKGDQCEFLQSNLANFSSSLIVSNLASAIANDKVLNKIVNTATQDNSIEQKGLDSLISALLFPLIVIVIGMSFVGGNVVKSKAFTYFVVFALIAVTVLGILKALKKWPFAEKKETPQYWVCETDANGFNTGKCVEEKNEPSGTFFSSQDLCQSNVSSGNACVAYWGCEYAGGFNTGNVKQCKDVLVDGNYCPYSDNKSAVTNCHSFFYECQSGDDGKNNCVRINPPDSSYQGTVYQSVVSADDALSKCKPNCTN